MSSSHPLASAERRADFATVPPRSPTLQEPANESVLRHAGDREQGGSVEGLVGVQQLVRLRCFPRLPLVIERSAQREFDTDSEYNHLSKSPEHIGLPAEQYAGQLPR